MFSFQKHTVGLVSVLCYIYFYLLHFEWWFFQKQEVQHSEIDWVLQYLIVDLNLLNSFYLNVSVWRILLCFTEISYFRPVRMMCMNSVFSFVALILIQFIFTIPFHFFDAFWRSLLVPATTTSSAYARISWFMCGLVSFMRLSIKMINNSNQSTSPCLTVVSKLDQLLSILPLKINETVLAHTINHFN